MGQGHSCSIASQSLSQIVTKLNPSWRTLVFRNESARAAVQFLPRMECSRVDDISVDPALPQFGSVISVVGIEIEGVTNGCEGGEIATATSASDILDHDRT